MNVLYKFDSVENSYEVDGYPWGFRLKTKRRYWIETNKKRGDRFVYQTLNPKTNAWCKEKKGTYSDVAVMFLNEDNHVKYYTMGAMYGTQEGLNKFLSKVDREQLNQFQNEKLDHAQAVFKAREVYSKTKTANTPLRARQFKHKVTGEIKTSINVFELSQYEELPYEDDQERAEQYQKDMTKAQKVFINEYAKIKKGKN